MKTFGNITKHTDEGRICCINIGIKGTENAKTQFWTEDKITEEYVVKTGSAYLVNVSRLHSVCELESRERLFITYGFKMTYAEVLDFVKRKQDEHKQDK